MLRPLFGEVTLPTHLPNDSENAGARIYSYRGDCSLQAYCDKRNIQQAELEDKREEVSHNEECRGSDTEREKIWA